MGGFDVAEPTFAHHSNDFEGAKWLRGSLKCGASLLAVGSLLASVPAYAQDDPAADEPADSETIIVRGIRGALESAKETKREADTFVDSITASDISTLPDLSVAEALGRIPGLTVSRFPTGGGASPDFPSPEGRGNLIRGLGFVRSEFNGRDAFTANAGRALDWSSIPPELVGAVDVWKNQTSDLIEGGIGGTINLRTLEPFDRPGRIIAATLDGTYSDLRKKWSPSGSLTIGDRWETSGGSEFGLMASYSRSLLDSRIHGWQQSGPNPRVVDANGQVPNTAPTGGARINEFTGVDPQRIVGTTTGFQMRTNDVDRDRESFYGAAQWKNSRLQLTAKFVRVDTKIDSIERTFEWWPEHDTGANMTVTDMVTNPAWSTSGTTMCSGPGGFPSNPGDCETLIPIRGGLMESGFVSNVSDSWTGAYGAAIGSLGIGKKEDSRTQDISLNAKWEVTDRLYAEFDGHYTKSKATFTELWGGLNSWANWWIDQDLDKPQIEFSIDPRTRFAAGNTRFAGDTDANQIAAPTSLADPNGANLQFVADRWQVGTGDLYALRGDFRYDLTGGDGAASWFKAVKFGARYSERSQTNSEMGLNWGAIAPAWAGGYGIVGTFQNPGAAVEAVDFSNFFRGGVVQGSETDFLFVHQDLLTDYSKFRQYLLNEPQVGTNHPWAPRGTDDGTAFGSPNFRPEDTSDITETTKNAYVRLDFEHDFAGGMSIDGNIGLRYVRTDLSSSGFRAYRAWNADDVQPTFVDGVRVRTDDAESRDDPRDFLPQATAYAAQAPVATTVDIKDTRWLPSFNLKWNLNADMLVRFGVSKGLSRPNVQDLRASQEYVVTTNRINFPQLQPGDPLFGIDRGAADINVGDIRVNRGNPFLQPTTAWNYDLSYEYYFPGGYVSLAGFYKDIKNVIVNGDMSLGTETLDGQQVNIIYNGPVNQAEAKVKGFEIAYQQFYDFLPGLLGNLGFQANYTFIDASTTPPPNGVDTDGDGNPDDVTTVFRWGVSDMLGQSKHIANAVAIYQDDNFEARLAYGWRSRYLTTYRDWVTGNPIYNSAAGFLDASVKYKVTEELQLRASIANILDTKSKAKSQIDQAGTTYDRFSFLNDRRIVVGVFLQF
jgi:iron complex outermembrane receptor protein